MNMIINLRKIKFYNFKQNNSQTILVKFLNQLQQWTNSNIKQSYHKLIKRNKNNNKK